MVRNFLCSRIMKFISLDRAGNHSATLNSGATIMVRITTHTVCFYDGR